MGFRKKKANYEFVTNSKFVRELVSEVNQYLTEMSEEDERVKVAHHPQFGFAKKSCVFEIVTEHRSIREFDKDEDLLSQMSDDGVLADLAEKIYETAAIRDLETVQVAAAYTDCCPKSRKPGLILFWQKG